MQSKSLITIIIVLLKDQSFTPIHHLGFFFKHLAVEFVVLLFTRFIAFGYSLHG